MSDETYNPANSEELLGVMERWKDARTTFREEIAQLRYELLDIRRVHGPGPHMVAPGVSITISRTGKPKQV